MITLPRDSIAALYTPEAKAKAISLGTISAEGFVCPVSLYRDSLNREKVMFTADADIDADGANGQHGAPAAYVVGDKGTEFLANGGLDKRGRIAQSWAKDIFILGSDNQPKVFSGGILASTTWYRHRDKAMDDPAAYLDSETEDYIVVPPLIIQGTRGVVRGCLGRITHQGRSVWTVTGDKGPRNRIGEVSISAARAILLNPSPKNGGTDKAQVFYELWPGVPAPGYELQHE